VADKLVVAVALVLLLSKEVPAMFGLTTDFMRIVLSLTAIVIIGREIAISALREWMAEIGARRKVAVSRLGKYKTILQIVGLSCMLFRWSLPIAPGIVIPIFEIGLVLTVVAAVLTLLSAIAYLRAAWPELQNPS
jgi:CDP-diacylglycerol--glycerol-3-phosphate 3-phosphatidyltransferase/cardiolipin synthase